MGRRKLAALERAVIGSARAVQRAHNDRTSMLALAIASTCVAIEALDAYLDQDLSGAGSYVEGSPETSRNSALAMLADGPTVRRKILDQIRAADRGPDEVRGLTDFQLEGRLKMLHQTESAARHALVEKGWIIDSGYRRTNPVSELPCAVYWLSPAARRHFLQVALVQSLDQAPR